MAIDRDDKNWHLIGKVHSAQGVRGQIFVLFYPESTPWIKKWKTLVLSETDLPNAIKKEYPISRVAKHGKQGKQGYIVTLEHVTDKDVADELAKRFIWIPSSFLKTDKGEETIYLKEISGFAVIDKIRGEVGTIIGFSSNGPQDLIVVKTREGNYDIPLVKPFIIRIEFELKKIYMDIPQGLLGDD